MEFEKMSVVLSDGYTYVFVCKEGRTYVKIYDKEGKRTAPMLEVLQLTDPELRENLKFIYDNGVVIDEMRTSATITKIHVE